MPDTAEHNITVFVIQDGTTIIATKVETLHLNTGENREHIIHPCEFYIDIETGSINISKWPIVESVDGIYPVPKNILEYIPCKAAVEAYNRIHSDRNKYTEFSNLH